MSILVTGAAGFIGAAVAERLLARGDRVIGLDNLNSYYSPALKQQRLQRLERHSNFHFQRLALEDTAAISELFRSEGLKRVIHLAAQAGVRYSIENPLAYVNSNVVGRFSRSWRAAATTALSTWCTRPAVRSMEATAACHSQSSRPSTTQSACMRPRKKPMS